MACVGFASPVLQRLQQRGHHERLTGRVLDVLSCNDVRSFIYCCGCGISCLHALMQIRLSIAAATANCCRCLPVLLLRTHDSTLLVPSLMLLLLLMPLLLLLLLLRLLLLLLTLLPAPPPVIAHTTAAGAAAYAAAAVDAAAAAAAAAAALAFQRDVRRCKCMAMPAYTHTYT